MFAHTFAAEMAKLFDRSKYQASQASASLVVTMQTFLEVLTYRLLPLLHNKNSEVGGFLGRFPPMFHRSDRLEHVSLAAKGPYCVLFPLLLIVLVSRAD